MPSRERPLRLRLAKGHGFGVDIGFARQCGAHSLEQGQLGFRRRGLMVGDVVALSREAIEGHHHCPVARLDDEGRDREVFVPVALAGGEIGGRLRHGHARAAWAWARPFQKPPLPVQTSTADWTVNRQ